MLESTANPSPGDSPGTAQPITLNSRVTVAGIPTGASDYFQINPTGAGNLSVQVDAGGQPVSLTLLDAQGAPVVRSDGASANAGPAIVHSLLGGQTYFLRVANLSVQPSSYRLTAIFTPSDSVLHATPVPGILPVLAKGDFDGDGRLDIATPLSGSNLAIVLLSNGDTRSMQVDRGTWPVGTGTRRG